MKIEYTYYLYSIVMDKTSMTYEIHCGLVTRTKKGEITTYSTIDDVLDETENYRRLLFELYEELKQ